MRVSKRIQDHRKLENIFKVQHRECDSSVKRASEREGEKKEKLSIDVKVKARRKNFSFFSVLAKDTTL